MRTILGILLFYGRFGLSFSAIGFLARRLFWKDGNGSLEGKTVMVTGASGGIGEAVVAGCAGAGASVIAVARNPAKLDALRSRYSGDITTSVCDLADSDEVRQLAATLRSEGRTIDVLVNNVGVMLHEFSRNKDQVDTQFATNLLNQYLLTEQLQADSSLAEDGAVITVASGGMYMAPLVTAVLASQEAGAHDGTRAYAVQKRAQVELTEHWRTELAHNGQDFYVMHPGWVDTDGVKQSLPTFRKLLAPILRDAGQGADTIVWLAKNRPASDTPDRIWFDRKARKTHAYGFTQQRSESKDQLLAYLKKFL